jgi:AcrR family transcriptional regulator
MIMAQKVDKKRAILKTASRIFGQNGFENALLDEIAVKAHVAKGTIFYYFKNKDELFSALIEEGINILVGEITSIKRQTGSPQQKLERVIEYHFSFFQEHSSLCLMIFNQVGSLKKRWRKSFDLIGNEYIPALQSLIDDCKAAGVVNAELTADAIVVSLFSLFTVSGIDWSIFHSRVSNEEITANTKAIILRGILKK